MENSPQKTFLTKFATVLIILYGIYYTPIDTYATDAPIKNALMAMCVILLFTYTFKISKALIIGAIFIIYQYFIASFHPETFRWSTYIYTVVLVVTYICMYNLIYIEKVFTINHFIKICKWMMMAYFVVCIIQQIALLAGINVMIEINLWKELDRGIGCNSLANEPSHFARFMLVFYYAYVKCQEYKRGEGPFTLKELFSGEHKWVTIRFLWMMFTMGSGTAFVCLILLSLYFVRRHNWHYMIPTLIVFYALIQASGVEHLDRATSVMNEAVQLDQKGAQEADGSGASRISPLFNSFTADYTKFETWFGYGIDYAYNNGLVTRQKATLFDDYGVIWYILSLVFTLSCAYRFWSLATIFMFAGVGGGFTGGNIQYTWELAIVITCVRYFYENRYNPEIYEEEEDNEIAEDEYISEEIAAITTEKDGE